jgi:hypothetical protein
MAHDFPARERAHPPKPGGLSNNPVLGFVPWVVFWVVAGPRTWELGAVCALIASVVLLLVGIDAGPLIDRGIARSADAEAFRTSPVRFTAPKILDVGTAVFFLALVIAGAILNRQDLITLENYSQAISSGALALIVLLSVAVGHPFTEQYARAMVPPERWHTPLFRHMMVTMSSVWAAIFAVMAILGAVSQTGISGAGSSDWLNWFIPIALIVLGLKFNEWYPARVKAALPHGSAPRIRDSRPSE